MNEYHVKFKIHQFIYLWDESNFFIKHGKLSCVSDKSSWIMLAMLIEEDVVVVPCAEFTLPRSDASIDKGST